MSATCSGLEVVCSGCDELARQGLVDNDRVGPALAIARAIASDVGLMALFTQKAWLDQRDYVA